MNKQKLKEDFIQKAKKVHGDKYDYSKVDYVNNKTKVLIKCKQCGKWFEVRPDNHINKRSGCPICSKKSRYQKDNKLFIKKLNDIFGGKYDYSKVKYINENTKICIICPIHGEFLRLPSELLKGLGCQKCQVNYSKTKEEIYHLLKEKYFEFDFDVTNYENSKSNIIVFDDLGFKHSVSLQTLLTSRWYPQKIESTEELKYKLQEKFGDYYCYDKVEFTNRNNPITLIVKKTNKELTHPYSYFFALKHPVSIIREKMTTEKFIKEAKKIHGDKYDYSKVKYINEKN